MNIQLATVIFSTLEPMVYTFTMDWTSEQIMEYLADEVTDLGQAVADGFMVEVNVQPLIRL